MLFSTYELGPSNSSTKRLWILIPPLTTSKRCESKWPLIYSRDSIRITFPQPLFLPLRGFMPPTRRI
jgi:hypothetical protein